MNREENELKLASFRLVLTERDRKIFNAMAAVFLPLLAAAAIHAFQKGEVHLVLSNTGIVIVFISYLIGNHGFRIFAAESGSVSEKVLALMTFGGLFIAATGWAYRVLS